MNIKTLNLLHRAMLLCIGMCIAGCINYGAKKQSDSTGDDNQVSTAQDDVLIQNSNHLKFKGVPIDGTLNKFVSRMIRFGFEVIDKDKGTAVLNGDFSGFKDCTIYVYTLDEQDLVSTITVAFPIREQWNTLYKDYSSLKSLLTEKYGNPSKCTEQFQNEYGFKLDDHDKFYKVWADGCEYRTCFSTAKGDITLSITHKQTNCFVALEYQDKINVEAVKTQALDDL